MVDREHILWKKATADAGKRATGTWRPQYPVLSTGPLGHKCRPFLCPSPPCPLLPSGIQGRKERCAVVFVLLFGHPGPGRMEPGQLAIVDCKGQRLAWPGFRAPSQYLETRTPPSGNQGRKDTCLHIPSCGPLTLVLKNKSN